MKIAQLASNFRTIDPQANGAIYSHVAWLTNGLINSGHQIELYASGDSHTKAKLHSVTKKSTVSMKIPEMTRNYYLHWLISLCYKNAKKYDIIHSHFFALSAFYSNLVETPTVQSIHHLPNNDLRQIANKIKNNKYISFSLAQRRAMPELNWVGNIYHGVDTNIFCYNPEPADYCLYLGRIAKDKGTHLAIEAAKNAKLPLIIAGASNQKENYWHEKIQKHIDGKKVRYVGEANFKEKINYLRNAKVVLMPSQIEETFGYVLIEAMSCGTPAIGWNYGAIPEIISHNKTGYVVDNIQEMAQAIKSIDKISRQETRKRAERYFSVEKMVAGYAKVYQRVIEEHNFKNNKKNQQWL